MAPQVAAPLFLLHSVRELIPLDYPVLQLGDLRVCSDAARRSAKHQRDMLPRAAMQVPLWVLVAAQGACLSAALYRTADMAGPPPLWQAHRPLSRR